MLITTLILSALASAQPNPEGLALLQNGYRPALAIKETASGLSLMGCPLKDLHFRIQDPMLPEPAEIRAKVYLPSLPTSRSIILLPPTGGENILDRGYANTFCAAGFRVVLLQSWSHDTDADLDLGLHDRNAVRAISAVRNILDYLQPSRPDQVGIFGTSVGALTSALALGFDSRLNAGALVVGGTGMAEMIFSTNEQNAAALRKERLKRYASPEEYLRDLQKNIKIEPAEFADFSGPKKVLAVVATQDQTVPTRHQWALVDNFNAQAITLATDHTGAILWAFLTARPKFVRFFEETLRELKSH